MIGIGPNAIPFLLHELERAPDDWFWALNAITEIDPVPEESQGNLREMTEAWSQWGRSES